MLPQFLLPETVARQYGVSAELALEKRGKPLLLTLGITQSTEQECLDISIWGSADGERWREVARFPQKFYCGTYSMVLDLTRETDLRYIRAHWKMGRWADAPPLFGFYLHLEEVQIRRAGAA